MHCDGKCYLNKQLKKVEEKETDKNSFPNSILKLKSVDNFVIEIAEWNLNSNPILFIKNSFKTSFFTLLTGHQNSLFQPPEFI